MYYQIIAVRESGIRISTFLADTLEQVALFVAHTPAVDGWYEVNVVEWIDENRYEPALFSPMELARCTECGFLEEPANWWKRNITNHLYEFKCCWCDQYYDSLEGSTRVCSV